MLPLPPPSLPGIAKSRYLVLTVAVCIEQQVFPYETFLSVLRRAAAAAAAVATFCHRADQSSAGKT